MCPHGIQENADHRLSWVRHSKFRKKGRIYMKAKKTRTIKMTLQITVLCLFAAAFLLPKGSQSYLMTGIAAAGVLVSLAILIIPPLASGLRKLRIPTGRATDTGNGNSDLETILIRQISYQITDTLQSAFPEATWEFAEPLPLSHLLDGDAIRLSTRNTGNHNFAEVSMDEYGSLHLQMLTVSALKRKGDKSASPDTPKVDPASWYSLIGKPFLVEMIGNLQAKGHQKLFIGEQGDVYILNGKEPEVKGKLEHFPPKAYWPALLQVFADDELEAAETENAVEITWA